MVCDLCGKREATIILERDPFPKDKRQRRIRHFQRDEICRWCYEQILEDKLEDKLEEARDGT